MSVPLIVLAVLVHAAIGTYIMHEQWRRFLLRLNRKYWPGENRSIDEAECWRIGFLFAMVWPVALLMAYERAQPPRVR